MKCDNKTCCTSLVIPLNDLNKKCLSFSFLYEKRLSSSNDHEHKVFYTEISELYYEITKVQLLSSHIFSVGIDIQAMERDFTSKLQSKIKEVGDRVIHLLVTFPKVEITCLKNISIWYGNLNSIEKYLKVSSNLVTLSKQLKDDVNNLLLGKVKIFIGEVQDVGSINDFVRSLLVVKQSSIYTVHWTEEINSEIDKLLIKASRKSDNNRFLLDVANALCDADGNDASTSQQLYSDHDSFEGAVNSFFNSSTKRQDIKYVVTWLDLNSNDQNAIQEMYSIFSHDYEMVVKKGLLIGNNEVKTKDYFDLLITNARQIGNDYNINYRTQITSLTAKIFGYWSLKNTNDFVSGNIQNNEGYSEFLLKPHPAQVVAIWILLNYKYKDYRLLEDHFVEILTGEGKSIILGVTATILGIMQCDVTCISYSKYLSERDYNQFEGMISDFGVSNFVKYVSVDQLCNEILNEGGDIRELTKDILINSRKTEIHHLKNTKMKVLLIDEVDVLFKEDVFGNSYSPGLKNTNNEITELMDFIWSKKDDLDENSLLRHETVKTVLSLFSQNAHDLILSEIKKMLLATKNIEFYAKNTDYIITDKKIGFKEFDGINFGLTSYDIAFAAKREFENGNISEANLRLHYGLQTTVGSFSYAELPLMYDLILGVTGTLKTLTSDESQILKDHYGISNMTFIPSVYGNNKLLFAGDNARGMYVV